MESVNYRKLFAIQANLEKKIKQACPSIDNKSGIYVLTREDESDKYAYIGKAVNLLKRMVSHLHGYEQRIDVSLKKRGFYSKENELGWQLHITHYPENILNDIERNLINKYKENGYILYNIESGGTKGKHDINERKPAKNYHDGLKQGYNKARKQISMWFDKYLDYTIKGVPNAVKLRYFEKFKKFISGEEEKDD